MSITLTTPKKVDINGVTQENSTDGAAVMMHVDYLANTATFIMHIGTIVGTPPNLNIGVYSSSLTVVIDLKAGTYKVLETGQAGAVPTAELDKFNTQIKAERNEAEVLATLGVQPIMPGTHVPW